MGWNPAGLSPVGFGGWEAGGGRTWGANASRDDVIGAMLAAFDAGVNWVDTAAVYGAGGGSETIVGEAIADRRALLVSTEVAPEPLARFRKDGLVWSIEEIATAHRPFVGGPLCPALVRAIRANRTYLAGCSTRLSPDQSMD